MAVRYNDRHFFENILNGMNPDWLHTNRFFARKFRKKGRRIMQTGEH